MRGRLGPTLTTLVAVAVAVAVALSPGPAAAAGQVRGSAPGAGSPTRAQIRRAIARARRSSYLWATVNVCVPKPQRGGVIGIRGEMPALGFRTTLSMTIQLGEYLTRVKRYVPVTGATARRTVVIGPLATGVHQDGVEFPYATETSALDATVTFTWTRDGRQLLRMTRTTTGGHPSAAFGEPPGHSSASCRL
jgi:hypothetical protein